MSPNIDHYDVNACNGDCLRVHFKGTSESKNEKAVVQGIKDGIICSIPKTASGLQSKLSTSTSVFRKMGDAEVRATLSSRGLAASIKGTNNRKYITESFSKAMNFTNNKLSPAQLAQDKIVEFKVGKTQHKIIKACSIAQQNSKSVNPKANVFNVEGIKNPSKVNLGIHPSNISEFNSNIKDIIVLNPESPLVKNKLLRYLSTNKLMVTSIVISVVLEGVALTIAVFKDGKKIGQHTVTQLGSTLGSIIGAVLCSMIPGIGTLIGGILGGIIGGLIGSGLGSLLCSYLFPPVAQGDGPPPTEYCECVRELIYGLPEADFDLTGVYGVPESEFDDCYIRGVPEPDFELNIRGAPSPWGHS